jgi:prophage regulatory protein
MKSKRFLRIQSVIDKVGLSKSHLYAQIAKNNFPAPIKLGARSSAWVESEVEQWMEERTTESRGEEIKTLSQMIRRRQ